MRNSYCAGLLACILGLGGCGIAEEQTPAWLLLETGTHARLIADDIADPEHAYVFADEVSARASARQRDPTVGARQMEAGSIVTIQAVGEVAPETGARAVRVSDEPHWSGWVPSERMLAPLPPQGTELVANPNGGSQQQLYWEQDDDDSSDGVPFGRVTRVSYLGFSSDPGNPEYHVKVLDGPLAGQSGYVLGDELAISTSQGFALVEP